MQDGGDTDWARYFLDCGQDSWPKFTGSEATIDKKIGVLLGNTQLSECYVRIVKG